MIRVSDALTPADLTLLAALALRPSPTTIDLADRLDRPRPSTHVSLQRLEAWGVVKRVEGRGWLVTSAGERAWRARSKREQAKLQARIDALQVRLARLAEGLPAQKGTP